jgi:hypothetical protein
MAQSRRPSATRHTSKQQVDSSPTDTLKSVSSNTPPTPPYKRRPTGNENKSHPKTSPAKRDLDHVPSVGSSTSAAAKMSTGAVPGTVDGSVVDGSSSLAPQMKELGKRRVVSEMMFNGQRTNVVISIPRGGSSRSQSELKIVPTEFDDLESTSKGDLQFPLDGTTSLIPSGLDDVNYSVGSAWD